MSDLDLIAAEIRRQRRKIDDFLDSTANRQGEAAELVAKVERLRRRAAVTQAQGAAPGDTKGRNG